MFMIVLIPAFSALHCFDIPFHKLELNCYLTRMSKFGINKVAYMSVSNESVCHLMIHHLRL